MKKEEQEILNKVVDYINTLKDNERLEFSKKMMRLVANQSTKNKTESLGLLEELKMEITGISCNENNLIKSYHKNLN